MAGDKIQNDVHSQPVGRLENMAQVRVVAVAGGHGVVIRNVVACILEG